MSEFTGYIVHFFGGGQRQNGWFSGVFREYSSGNTFRVAGVFRNKIDTNLRYDIDADYVVNQYGEQYKINSMSPHIDLDRDSLIMYLSGDSFKGIGEVLATKIVDKYGTKTLDVIASDPDKLRIDLNLTDRQIGILMHGESSISIENKLRKLVPFISKTLIDKIVKKYCDGESGCGSNKAMSIIRNNPYQLLYDLENVKFKDIDEIALHLKFDKYNKSRIVECYKYAMYRYVNDTKNLFISTSDVEEYNTFYMNVIDNIAYMDSIQQGNVRLYPNEAYAAAKELFEHPDLIDDIVMVPDTKGGFSIYNKDVYMQETGIAEIIADRLASTSLFVRLTGCTVDDIEDDIAIYERRNRMQFDPSQRTGIITSLLSSISIINGGPGHGKTSTVDCILFIWSRHISEKNPVLSAPTGRAVSVLKNATNNEYDVATAMRRIAMMNRLQKMAAKHDCGENIKKEYETMSESFTETIVVLDECSMVGLKTAYEFMSMFEDCQFIFVGDVDQLPPIEYGQFFKDICDCNLIMKTCLTVNHRAEGKLIVDNAEAINRMDVNGIDYSDKDQFEMRPMYGDYSDEIINEYKKWVYSTVTNKDGTTSIVPDTIKMKTICILCPTRYGSTGYLMLNKTIQDLINPKNDKAKADENGYEIDATHIYINDQFKDVKLRVGDRVMQTRNRADAECVIIVGKKRQDSKGIFNGDTGVITSFNPAPKSDETDSITLLLDDGRETTIYEEDMKDLMLAYAISIHKSQGSEYDMVIISAQSILAMDNSYSKHSEEFACKNLLYTGVTRAKKCVKIIGNEKGVEKCILTEKVPRKSMLTPRVLHEFQQLKHAI